MTDFFKQLLRCPKKEENKLYLYIMKMHLIILAIFYYFANEIILKNVKFS